jgi:hypothetical protein
VSLNPNTANRVRGIGSANIAFNNIATTGRVPVDPLWMDSLELSRGPNANIFGVGNASGTVNQVPATANLTRDFTRVAQQLLGYYEYKDQQNRQYAYRHSALGLDKGWQQKYAALNAPLGNRVQQVIPNPLYTVVPGNYARINEQYYAGSTRGGGIEYAPSYFPEGVSVPYVWGPSPGAMFKDVSAIGFTPSFGGGGGAANVNTVVKTTGGVLQSSFLDGKLIGTFGLRQDEVYNRNAPPPTLTPDLRAYDFAASNQWNPDWRSADGKTKSTSVVVRPFRDLRYFKSKIDEGSGLSRFMAEAVSSLSLTYNKSDNFIAQGPAFDPFLNPLPNQTGTSKDIGFWMSMLDGKLSVRYNRFDTRQLSLRNGDITTMAQRILRYEGFVANDAWNLRTKATAWLNGLGPGACHCGLAARRGLRAPFRNASPRLLAGPSRRFSVGRRRVRHQSGTTVVGRVVAHLVRTGRHRCARR